LPGARKTGWIWAERMCAVVAALFVLAVNVPNLYATPSTYPWLLGGDVALACALVACIVIGQRRSRFLRALGWIGLLAIVALTVLKVM